MAINSYFYDIEVRRKSIETDDWGNESEDGAPWIFNQTIQGMIQPKTGNRVDRNNDNIIVSDYLLYTTLGNTVLSTDRIYFGDKYYGIVNMKEGTGVTTRQDHAEWDLIRIGDESNS